MTYLREISSGKREIPLWEKRRKKRKRNRQQRVQTGRVAIFGKMAHLN
jgi:C4-dicarboxylate-specific signal transduction histidine kinase